MSRIAFHRPARFLPPRLPDDKIVLPSPPEVPEGGNASGTIGMILPLISSVGMAGYMITFGRPILIAVGILFVVTSVSVTVAMRFQTKKTSRRANRRQRARYRVGVHEARVHARTVAAAQRMIAALTHPDPERLWAIATSRERVWE